MRASSRGLFCSTASRHWNMADTCGSLNRKAPSTEGDNQCYHHNQTMCAQVMVQNVWWMLRYHCNISVCLSYAAAVVWAGQIRCDLGDCVKANARLYNPRRCTERHCSTLAPTDWTAQKKSPFSVKMSKQPLSALTSGKYSLDWQIPVLHDELDEDRDTAHTTRNANSLSVYSKSAKQNNQVRSCTTV